MRSSRARPGVTARRSTAHRSTARHRPQVQSSSVILLREYICNVVQNRKIIIVLNCDVISTAPGGTIGQPVRLDDNGNPVPGAFAPGGAQQPPQQQ